MRRDGKTAGDGGAGGRRRLSSEVLTHESSDRRRIAPRPVWRKHLVRTAADWLNEYRDEIIDLPWPIWRMVRDRFGLSLAEAVEVCRMASADRNGGW